MSPWAPDAWRGGASSGSGAAVVVGLVPFALGFETWGSILSPAANCGITGRRAPGQSPVGLTFPPLFS